MISYHSRQPLSRRTHAMRRGAVLFVLPLLLNLCIYNEYYVGISVDTRPSVDAHSTLRVCSDVARIAAPYIHNQSLAAYCSSANARTFRNARRKLSTQLLPHVVRNARVALRDVIRQGSAPLSAWNVSAEGLLSYVLDAPHYVRPNGSLLTSTDEWHVQGPVVFFESWWPTHWGHVLPDWMPIIAWLRTRYPPNVRVALFNRGDLLRDVLVSFDDAFARERIVWLPPNAVAIVSGEATLLSHNFHYQVTRNIEPVLALGDWIDEKRRKQNAPLTGSSAVPRRLAENRRTVIYVSRRRNGALGVQHGRETDGLHEDRILGVIRDAMRRHRLKERLVIFRGVDKESTDVLREQFDLFSTARTVIGPHGAGMMNVVWMRRSSGCGHRPQVLEFLPVLIKSPENGGDGNYTVSCQKTVWCHFSTLPWIEFHNIASLDNSTHALDWIDLDDLKETLDAMWSREPRS